MFIDFRILDKFPSAEAQCQTRSKLPLDMIITDIVGLTQFKRKVKNGYGKFRSVDSQFCLFLFMEKIIHRMSVDHNSMLMTLTFLHPCLSTFLRFLFFITKLFTECRSIITLC